MISKVIELLQIAIYALLLPCFIIPLRKVLRKQTTYVKKFNDILGKPADDGILNQSHDISVWIVLQTVMPIVIDIALCIDDYSINYLILRMVQQVSLFLAMVASGRLISKKITPRLI